ncbi:hypothetical protein PV08_05165 [Exophiala spinifera]|uniref:Cupin type-2 domain-containing protein n=1 Tax=Exophiala spinifera TaxID=91928 RepID=A0A0D2BH85_9EURO|nr:uncharacterized protein PV08_05165 [Exophiala spinifera]KIW17970.1 hypothetical protein PV08_05165 [Exophiala spinifera]
MPSNREPSIIPFAELEPSWHVPGAKVGGTLRWLISWVGGRKGFVNSNPERAVINDEISVGLMYLPVGQRQEGLHYHTVTEIYVIVKGRVVGYDGSNTSHIAGPMDCIYIPAGVPHGVRNAGMEDVELIWLHDGVEASGMTIYCDTQQDLENAPSKAPIQVVQLQDLAPVWSNPRAKEPEFLRWVVNWIGGPGGFENLNPGYAVESEKIALGLTVLMPGNKQVPHCHSVAEVYVILKGKVLVKLDKEGKKAKELAYLDCAYFPDGAVHSLRNHGSEPAYIMWAHDRANRSGGTNYENLEGQELSTPQPSTNGIA